MTQTNRPYDALAEELRAGAAGHGLSEDRRRQRDAADAIESLQDQVLMPDVAEEETGHDAEDACCVRYQGELAQAFASRDDEAAGRVRLHTLLGQIIDPELASRINDGTATDAEVQEVIDGFAMAGSPTAVVTVTTEEDAAGEVGTPTV